MDGKGSMECRNIDIDTMIKLRKMPSKQQSLYGGTAAAAGGLAVVVGGDIPLDRK